MKKIIHRSVIPVYVAAGVWLLCCLLLPMYLLWHYLVYAAVTVAAYFVARHFFPGTVEEVELPQAPPDSGDPEVDALILQGRERLQELKTLGDAVKEPGLRAHVDALEILGNKIFVALEEDTSRLNRTRKFLNYYLPTTVTLLRRYRALERQQAAGENITSTMDKIEEMLGKVEAAFQKQLDNLYEAEAMDISADIQVMHRIMESEGLLPAEEQKHDTI